MLIYTGVFESRELEKITRLIMFKYVNLSKIIGEGKI